VDLELEGSTFLLSFKVNQLEHYMKIRYLICIMLCCAAAFAGTPKKILIRNPGDSGAAEKQFVMSLRIALNGKKLALAKDLPDADYLLDFTLRETRQSGTPFLGAMGGAVTQGLTQGVFQGVTQGIASGIASNIAKGITIGSRSGGISSVYLPGGSMERMSSMMEYVYVDVVVLKKNSEEQVFAKSFACSGVLQTGKDPAVECAKKVANEISKAKKIK
jgi:hypothetical protein